MAAGTIVVRERALRPPADLDEQLDDLAADELVFTPEQLTACSAADHHILRSFLQRYLDMDPKSRDQLAYRLADSFQRKLNYQPPAVVEPQVFLISLYRDLEHWARHGR